ncbi:MAG: ABC transporter substrate-binding protein [Parasporobacterium sp.]|nr:ABC transporter substrate-binding protein [Parasporobacterium sp.]
MKKAFTLILALLIILSCLVAGPMAAAAADAAPEEGQALVVSGEVAPNKVKSDETLNVVLPEEPATLIGSKQAGTYALPITNLLLDMPFKYNLETGEIEPYLFTGYEWVDDAHTKLKCTIRQGVKATDGSEFTANDVLFSFNEYHDFEGDWFTPLVDFENTEVVDDYTIIIGCASGNPTFANALSNRGNVYMIDESSYLASGGRDNTTNPQYGTGKYRFVEWIPGQSILLERNEEHWDTENVPYYKYIKFTFVPDAATRVMNIMSGSADVALAINIGQAAELVGNDKCAVTFVSTQDCNRFFMYAGEGHPTADKRVREAIRLALNTELLNQVHTSGIAPIEPFYVTSESKYYYDPTDGAGVEFNPEKAKELLAEAGYADGLVINGIAFPQNAAIMTAAQAMLKEVGITLDFTTPDVPTFLEMSKSGNFDLLFTELANSCKFFRDANVFTVIEPGAVAPGNPNIDDPDFLTTVVTAYSSLDEDEAVQAIKDIVTYLYDGAYMIGMGRSLNAVAHNPQLEGFYNGTGTSVDLSLVRPIGE